MLYWTEPLSEDFLYYTIQKRDKFIAASDALTPVDIMIIQEHDSKRL